jgi:hypothetical protein
MLCSESYGPGLEEIVLAYGYPFPVHKPLIEVETCFSQEQPSSTALEQVIARAEYRDSCYADLRWEDVVEPFGGSQDVPVPARSLDRRDQAVTVDGEERSVVVMSYGSYAALRFHRDTVTVTAVARLGPGYPCFPDDRRSGTLLRRVYTFRAQLAQAILLVNP